MKGAKRIISTSFWSDDKVMEFTPEDKYFMLFLLSCEYTNILGIYYLPIKRAAFDMGYNEDSIKGLLDRFENKYGIIRYSQATSEVAIKNYLMYSIMTGGKPVYNALVYEMAKVKDKSLLVFIYQSLSQKKLDNDTVREFITYLGNFLENDADAKCYMLDANMLYAKCYMLESGATRSRLVADSGATRKKPAPDKHIYGEYKHVKLSDADIDRLHNELGEEMTNECIQFLDEYCDMKKSYKHNNDYLCIKKWVIDAVNERKKKKTPTSKAADDLEASYRMMADWSKNHE